MERKNEEVRKLIGERLKDFRKGLGLSVWKISQKGEMGISQVHSIESGEKNYTIDSFFRYIYACDLYVYFATKDKKEEPHDFDDLADKGIKMYPEDVND